MKTHLRFRMARAVLVFGAFAGRSLEKVNFMGVGLGTLASGQAVFRDSMVPSTKT